MKLAELWGSRHILKDWSVKLFQDKTRRIAQINPVITPLYVTLDEQPY
jgi:hypothetical protein